VDNIDYKKMIGLNADAEADADAHDETVNAENDERKNSANANMKRRKKYAESYTGMRTAHIDFSDTDEDLEDEDEEDEEVNSELEENSEDELIEAIDDEFFNKKKRRKKKKNKRRRKNISNDNKSDNKLTAVSKEETISVVPTDEPTTEPNFDDKTLSDAHKYDGYANDDYEKLLKESNRDRHNKAVSSLSERQNAAESKEIEKSHLDFSGKGNDGYVRINQTEDISAVKVNEDEKKSDKSVRKSTKINNSAEDNYIVNDSKVLENERSSLNDSLYYREKRIREYEQREADGKSEQKAIRKSKQKIERNVHNVYKPEVTASRYVTKQESGNAEKEGEYKREKQKHYEKIEAEKAEDDARKKRNKQIAQNAYKAERLKEKSNTVFSAHNTFSEPVVSAVFSNTADTEYIKQENSESAAISLPETEVSQDITNVLSEEDYLKKRKDYIIDETEDINKNVSSAMDDLEKRQSENNQKDIVNAHFDFTGNENDGYKGSEEQFYKEKRISEYERGKQTEKEERNKAKKQQSKYGGSEQEIKQSKSEQRVFDRVRSELYSAKGTAHRSEWKGTVHKRRSDGKPEEVGLNNDLKGYSEVGKTYTGSEEQFYKEKRISEYEQSKQTEKRERNKPKKRKSKYGGSEQGIKQSKSEQEVFDKVKSDSYFAKGKKGTSQKGVFDGKPKEAELNKSLESYSESGKTYKGSEKQFYKGKGAFQKANSENIVYGDDIKDWHYTVADGNIIVLHKYVGIERLLRKYGYSSVDEFRSAFGNDKIAIAELEKKLNPAVSDSYTADGVKYNDVMLEKTVWNDEKRLYEGVFSNNPYLQTVSIGSKVRIRDNNTEFMFVDCVGLKKVIGGGENFIQNNTFRNCPLMKINVKSVEEYKKTRFPAVKLNKQNSDENNSTEDKTEFSKIHNFDKLKFNAFYMSAAPAYAYEKVKRDAHIHSTDNEVFGRKISLDKEKYSDKQENSNKREYLKFDLSSEEPIIRNEREKFDTSDNKGKRNIWEPIKEKSVDDLLAEEKSSLLKQYADIAARQSFNMIKGVGQTYVNMAGWTNDDTINGIRKEYRDIKDIVGALRLLTLIPYDMRLMRSVGDNSIASLADLMYRYKGLSFSDLRSEIEKLQNLEYLTPEQAKKLKGLLRQYSLRTKKYIPITLKNLNRQLDMCLTDEELLSLKAQYGKLADLSKTDLQVKIRELIRKCQKAKKKYKLTSKKYRNIKISDRKLKRIKQKADKAILQRQYDRRDLEALKSLKALYQTNKHRYGHLNKLSTRKLNAAAKKLNRLKKAGKISDEEAELLKHIENVTAKRKKLKNISKSKMTRKNVLGIIKGRIRRILSDANDDTINGLINLSELADNRFVKDIAINVFRINKYLVRKTIHSTAVVAEKSVKATVKTAEKTVAKAALKKPIAASVKKPIAKGVRKVFTKVSVQFKQAAQAAEKAAETVGKAIIKAAASHSGTIAIITAAVLVVTIVTAVISPTMGLAYFRIMDDDENLNEYIEYIIKLQDDAEKKLMEETVPLTVIQNLNGSSVYYDRHSERVYYLNLFNELKYKSDIPSAEYVTPIAQDKASGFYVDSKDCKITKTYSTGKNNNIKELLSMAAIYFNQDLSDKDAVKAYLKKMFELSNLYECDLTRSYNTETKISTVNKYHQSANHWGVGIEVKIKVIGFDDLFYLVAEESPTGTAGGGSFDSSGAGYVPGTYLGNFMCTHYCTGTCCNGSWGNSTKWKGTPIQPGYTVAVDESLIPLGTKLFINGHLYLAEDTGGAIKGKHIDISVASHEEANRLGVKYYDVYIAEPGTEGIVPTAIPAATSSPGSGTGFVWDENNQVWAKRICEQNWKSLYDKLKDEYLDMIINSGEYYGTNGDDSFATGDVLSDDVKNKIMEQCRAETISESRLAVISWCVDSVGKIPYYWGGAASNPNYGGNAFGSAVSADSKGRTQKGLDCSHYVDWVFWTAVGNNLGNGSTVILWDKSSSISQSDLKPGDLGFRNEPGGNGINHVGIYVGNGQWIHCSSSTGSTYSPNYSGFHYYRRVNIFSGE